MGAAGLFTTPRAPPPAGGTSLSACRWRGGPDPRSLPPAAMCIAVGKVSLDDWDMLISSFGCRSFLPAISLPRLAMTSLAFMLDCVPEPVCQTTSGKLSSSFPEMTSVAACSMAVTAFSLSFFPGAEYGWLAAAAFFRTPKAWAISRGIVSIPTPMGSFCGCARSVRSQYLSAGTGPRPSNHAPCGIPSKRASPQFIIFCVRSRPGG